MSDFELRKNPKTGEVVFWEPGSDTWSPVQARRNPDTGEVAILPQGGAEWRNLGVYGTNPAASAVAAGTTAPAQPVLPGAGQQPALSARPSPTPGVVLPAALAAPSLPQPLPASAPATPAMSQPTAAVPPRTMPASPRLQTEGPGPGGGMRELYDQGILPRRYVDDPLAAPALPQPALPAAPDPFAGEPFGDLATRRGQQVAQGATEVFASIPEAAAIRGAGADQATQQRFAEEIEDARAQIAEIDRRMAAGEGDPERLAAVRADLVRTIANTQPLLEANVALPIERTLFGKGDELRDASAEVFGTPDPRDTSFWSQVAQGAGNMGAMAISSIAAGVVNPALGVGVGAGQGSAMNRSQVYREAIEAGADEATAQEAGRWAAAIGASEIIPISRALKVLPPRLRGEMTTGVMRRFVDIAQGAGEEAAQEYLATVANNIVAEKLYDPQRGWTDGATEAALVGAVLGGGIGAVGTAFDRGGATPPVTRPPAPQDEPPEAQTTPSAPSAPTAPAGPAASPPPAPAAPTTADADLAATMQPRPAPQAAPATPEGRFEIMDEVETVDGETRPTGRKVRVNLDTGEVSPVDADQPQAAQGQSQAVPDVGSEDAPAADSAVDDDESGSDAQQDGLLPTDDQQTDDPGRADPEDEAAGDDQVGTIRTQTLTSEEVGKIGTDAATFQYKDNGDESGVTDRLRGVTDWDERSAMGGIVYEYADGRRVVADGHQRLGLAKALQAEGKQTPWNVEIIREADGFTPADVRRIAALKNIREGSGTAIDAAKVLREAPDDIDSLNLPPRSALVRDARGLSRLSDDAFGMVINDVVKPEWGAVVGENVTDPALHADVVSLLNKLQPKNNAQAAMIAQQAGQNAQTETQASLFGDQDVAESLYLERAKVLDAALRRIKKDRATFKVLSDRAETIQQAGNVLDQQANAQRVEADSKAAAYLNAEANRKGPISDALSKAARELKANPRQGSRIVGDFLAAVRDPQGAFDTETGGPDRGSADPAPDAGQDQQVTPKPETETTDAGQQSLIPGVAPITDKERLEAQMNRPLTGGNASPGGGRDSLFGDPDERGDLFAPDVVKNNSANSSKQENQDTAGTYVDRAKGNDRGGFKDRRKELPDRLDPDNLGAEAQRLTLEPGRRDGIEYIMLIDAKGQIIAYGSGTKNSTGVPAGLNLALDKGESIVAHHNHPASTSFSSSDISIALQPGTHAVYAHGHDGTVYRVEATPTGRAMMMQKGQDGSKVAKDLGNVSENLWDKSRGRLSAMIRSDKIENGSEEPHKDRQVAFALAMQDAGLIRYDVTGPGASRVDPANNMYLNDPELKRVYKNMVEAFKRRAKAADKRGTDDRPAPVRSHIADLEGFPLGTADSDQGRPEAGQQRPVRDDVSGRNPAGQAGDQGEGSGGGGAVTPKPDPDFDGALDDMFGGDAGPTPAPAPSATFKTPTDSTPAAKPKRSKADIAKDMKNILRGLKEQDDLFGGNDPDQPARTMTQAQRAELETRAKQSKMRTGKPQKDAGPLFGDRDDLFGGLDEGAIQVSRSGDFKDWFGESLVVDKDGKPLVVFHGSDVSVQELRAGNPSWRRTANPEQSASVADAVFFSDSPDVAASHAFHKMVRGNFEGAQTYPVFLAIKNPLVIEGKGAKTTREMMRESIAEAHRGGHDGLIVRDVVDDADQRLPASDVFVTFNTSQIRSVFDGNAIEMREDWPETFLQQMDALNSVSPGWDSSPGGMLTNPTDKGGIIDKRPADDRWFIVFGNGFEIDATFATRGEAVAEFVRSMKVGTDPSKYAQLAPLFIEALDGADVRGAMAQSGRRSIFASMMKPLVDAGLTRDDVKALQPYFTRFLDDVEAGRIDLEGEANAPSTGGDLEPDRGDADTGDDVGGTDVSATGGGTGSRSGSGGSASGGGPGGQRQGGGGVSDGDAAGVGARGDSGVSAGGRGDGQSASDRDSAGSRDRGEQRLPDDQGRAEDTERYATDGPDVTDRKAAQKAADKVKVRPADRANIDKTLPLLLDVQRDDVAKVEARFAKPDGHGMLLTNGTGTGKTYSGGGVIKRFAQQGKDNILILAPSQGILDAWVEMGADMGLDISKLDDTQSAGTGIVATTYANAGENTTLAGRDWDLVVSDESQKLNQNAAGDSTAALDTLRAITNRPENLWRRARMVNADAWAEWKAMPGRDTKMLSQEQRQQAQAAKDARRAELQAADKALIKKWEKAPRSKVLFLSATPFAYDKNVDYGEGYLFNYGASGVTDSGSRQDGRAFFFVENFGYRIRSHKLTKPEAAVDSGVFERNFHEKLKRDGVLSGRQLDIEADYDRRFQRISTVDGEQIDAAMKLIWDKQSTDKANQKKWRDLSDHVRKNFTYLRRLQLLEAIKADAAIPDIQKHLDMGRKVVVFHDYNKGGGINPFTGSDLVVPTADAMEAYRMLVAEMPQVAGLNFSGLQAPVDALTKAFGKRARVYNGTVSGKDRAAAKADFNRDGSGVDVIIVQSAAGEAGISLHDTTGGHQRALINLGMPVRPTTTLQEEGRIRRVGSVSDAIFRYYTTGTTWERQAFANKIAENSGTVENLALGNDARAIRDAFINAYMDADVYPPGMDGEGKGGKEADRATATTSPYDEAKTHYFGRMKNARSRGQRQGVDFYATPEPLGFKMAEWAQISPYQRALEPSAGDGAIARYLPGHADRTMIEPSADLATRAELRAPGAKVVQERFEDHHIVNKYDAVVMNPPFGSGGKTAMDHLAKAMRHTRPGGRVVALIPTGPAADKQFEKMLQADGFPITEWNFTADISLPAVTFEKAGTNVRAHVVIFDRVMSPDNMSPTKHINMTGSDSIGHFFDRLEGIGVPDRPTVPEAVQDAEADAEVSPPAVTDTDGFDVFDFVNSKTGADAFGVQIKEKLGDRYKAVLAIAKSHGGYYSRYQNKANGAKRGFLFPTDAARKAFIEDVQKPQIGGLEEDAKEERRQPVVRLTGEELAGDGIKELRRAAQDWYSDNLVGTTATMADGSVVRFNGRGMRKATSRGAPILRFVPAIRNVIESGTVVREEPGRDQSTVRMRFVSAPVDLAGEVRNIVVSIRQTTDGEYHYSLSFDGDDQARPRGADGDHAEKRLTPVWNQPDRTLNMGFERDQGNNTDSAAEALQAAMPGLRAELDRMNLKRVRLGVDMSGDRLGAFRSNADGMEILIGRSLDPEATLHHEAIHALRAMDLFTPAEWRALEIKGARTWVEQYDIAGRYPDLLPAEQIEEAIAEAFADAAKTRTAPKGSILVRAFNKIARFFNAMGNALRGAGFQSAEAVLGRAMSGEIGARDRGGMGFQARMREQRPMRRRQTAQQRAHTATSMGATGGYAFIPDRRVFEELATSQASIWQRFRSAGGAVHDWVDKGRVHIQDRFLPVLRAQQAVLRQTGAAAVPETHNAYLAEETFSGKVGRHLFEIDEDYTKSIIDIMAGGKGEPMMDPDDVGTWLYARHAIERNERIASINPDMPDGGSGMMTADAQQILADVAASPNAARYQQIGDLIDKLRERTLKLREDAGLITPDEADLWRNQYKHYVPLKGFADTDHSEAMLDMTGMGRRYNTRGGESKQALGRNSEAFNPLQGAITQAQEVAIRAEKNRVGQALYNLAKDFPSPDLWSVKTPKQKRYFNRTTGLVETRVEDPVSLFMEPNEMAVKIGGKERRILFNDPRLARAAGSVGADQMGAITRFVSMFGRYFSSINTMLNPVFTVVNGFRDMITAQISVGHFGGKDAGRIRKAMLKSWPKAFMGSYRGQRQHIRNKKGKPDTEWEKYYREFDSAGAKVAFWRIEQPEAEQINLRRRVRDIGGNAVRRRLKYLYFSTRDNPVLGFVERTNLAVDNAIRLAAYVEARKAGWTQQEAASLSRNMTVNFNRRGELGAGLNAWYVFFNAAVQGTHTLARSMKSKQVRRILLSLIALSALQDLVNAALSEEDEDGELAYDKIPIWKSQMNSIFMLGGGDAGTIPLPYGYNTFTFAGQQIGKVARGVKSSDDALRDTALTAFTAFSPISGSTGYSMIMPTILDPVSEMAMNEDWLGRPIRPEPPFNDYGPDAYKFYRGASNASKAIADIANRATGGDEAQAGWIDVSPEYIDHTMSFLTGGAGRFVGETGDLISKAVRGEWEDIEQRDIPFADRVYTTTGDWLDRNRYYAFRDQVRGAREAAETYGEVGKPVPPDVQRLAGLYDRSRETEKVLRQLRKQTRAIDARDDLTPAEKSDRRAAIDERAAKVYLRFNAAFVRTMGRQGE